MQYELSTDAQWVTRELSLRVQSDTGVRALVLRRAADGQWTADRRGRATEADAESVPLPDLGDAFDCDLALCPLTNTMPILRRHLVGRSAHRKEGGTIDYVMAWVSVPDLIVRRSEQRYSVSDPVDGEAGALGYDATDSFRTTLQVDGNGLMVNYPGLAATDRDPRLTGGAPRRDHRHRLRQASPETRAEVLRLSLEHVTDRGSEPGCLLHSVHQDVEVPDRLVFLEHWVDRDALDTHFRVPESGGSRVPSAASRRSHPRSRSTTRPVCDDRASMLTDEFVTDGKVCTPCAH